MGGYVFWKAENVVSATCDRLCERKKSPRRHRVMILACLVFGVVVRYVRWHVNDGRSFRVDRRLARPDKRSKPVRKTFPGQSTHDGQGRVA